MNAITNAAHIENPPPRLVAAAIAELAAERVRESWRYLDAWGALEAAGVPRATIRECLADPLETEPLAELLAWIDMGERGLLGFVGPPGTGKTYAEARWVVDRHRRGEYTHWLAGTSIALASLRDRDALLGKAGSVRALVIDDIGAGAQYGDTLRDQLRGLIQHRIDELRPTVIASNGTAAELNDWLGHRIADRMQLGGGFVAVRSLDSLRGDLDTLDADPGAKLTAMIQVIRARDVKLDASGRGPEWYAHKRIVEIVGCEPVQRYTIDGEPLPLDLDVGGKLDRLARREGYEGCKRIRELLGLDARAVRAAAQQLGEAEARSVEWAAGTLGVANAAMSMTFEGVAAQAAETMRTRQAADKQRHESEVAAILEHASRRAARTADREPSVYLRGTPPGWAVGTDGVVTKEGRRRLNLAGFRVRCKGRRFSLYRDLAPEQHRRKDDAAVCLEPHCESEAVAWQLAALLCADVDTRPGGDAGA